MTKFRTISASRPSTDAPVVLLLALLLIAAIPGLSGCAAVVSGHPATETPPTPLSITVSSLPAATAQSAYSATLSATGATAPYKWSMASGTLPAGLAMSGAGQISGTPTQAGSFSFTAQVTDSSSIPQSASANLGLAVKAAAGAPLSISTSSLPAGQVSSAYATTLSGAGGTPAYSWTLVSGQLPPGLTLNAASGAIAGTPSQAGSYSFTVKLVDSSNPVQSNIANLSITIAAANSALQVTTSALPTGETGSAYAATLDATGGLAPYNWSLTGGTLPSGLTLSAAGQISGTPTQTANSSITVRVKDSASPAATSTKTLSMSVVLAGGTLQITTASLPNGQANAAYSTTVVAIGGTKPYAWSISSGSLPSGLALNSSAGNISGTPTQSGVFSLTIQAKDSAATPQTATKALSLNVAVAVAPIQITTAALLGGQANSTYGATLSASGGTTPYAWSLASGSLPTGLTLNGSTGQIGGTPTQAGTSPFTVQVKDSTLPAQTATKSFSITITAVAAPVQVTTSTLASGQVSSSYSASLTASGGTAPYGWSLSAGSLPAGLNLNSAGVISGTPTASGTVSFTVRVADSSAPAKTATANLSIAVAAVVTPPVTISTTSLPGGTVSSAYSSTLAAAGGTIPYNWSLSGGSLPAGLTLSGSGVISGTPTASGTVSFTVRVADSSAPAKTATANLSIAVAAVVIPPVTISTTSLPGGTVSSAYSTTLAAAGGTTPYSWSLSAGSLPAGLTLSSGGLISGTPTAFGTVSFTVRAADSSAPAKTATANLSIAVAAVVTPPVTISTTSLPGGTVSSAYSATLAAAGGTTPYSWSLSAGSLPAGVTLSGSGVISGTPTASGTASFTVRVADSSAPAKTATANLSIAVAVAVTPVTISTSSLPGGTVSSAYSSTLAAAGGTTPYSWSLSAGSLPAGLTLSGSGVISGTPTAAGTSSFTIKVTDSSAQSDTANLSLAISVATGGGGATVVLCPNNGETGNNANCAPSPTLDFGKQGTGTTSAALSISVNNCSTSNIAACTGTGSLTLGSPHYTITGPNAADFSNTGSGTCSNGLGLNSGSDCTIVLRFTPSQGAGTNESATLTVNSNGVGNPHTMSLTGTSAAVTTVSSCQNLNGGTNYQLTASVSAPGTCFTVGGSNTDINLNGFTVTYCTSSQSSLVGGVFMTGNPTADTTVHNGTINEGAGTCTGGNLHGAGPIIASSDGQSSVSRGTTVFNITSTFKAARGKFVWEENAGGGSSSGTTIHDVIYANNDASTCGSVSCRDQDQYYSIVIDQSKTAPPTVMYNVTGTGGTQGAIVSSARNSQFYNNFITSGNVTSTITNGFIFQDWGADTTIRENLTTGSGSGGTCLSCRGVQVSSANNVAVTGSVVQDNVLYTTNLNNDVEYGGCEIGGSYGIQINTAGSSSDLSNNTVQNNRATVTSSVCPGYAFSWSGATAANGPNKTNNNTFTCNLASGFTAGPCAGIRLDANQYNPGVAAVVGTGDTYKGDTSAIYIFYDGTPTWTCSQCTFGKGSNPISGWVMLDYDGGGQSGASSQAMFLVDPNFTDGATKDSNNLSKWASNNGSLSFSYTVQWTYKVTVKGASSGNSISGATVTARDSKGGQECSGPTDANGVFSCVVNDAKYAATSGNYSTTSYSPFAISIAKPGCTTLNYNLTLGSPTTETRTVPGC
jgi:hypothetical protein